MAIVLTSFFILCSIIYNGLSKGNTDFQKLAENTFALLFAFAALVFTWSRSIREDELALSRKLARLAERVLFTSFLFLLASLLNFYKNNYLDIFKVDNTFFQVVIFLTKILLPLLFFSGFVMVLILLLQAGRILIKRLI